MANGPDGCEAWLVAFSALVVNLISAGIFRAQGLLFVALMDKFGIDRQDAAMPFSVKDAIRNLFAPVVGIFGQRYGTSTVVLSGGVLATLSLAMTYFANDMIWVNILYGGINGVATSLVTVLPVMLIGKHFEKYRTTAAGLSLSGGCLGSLLLPLLMEYFLKQYGLNGTFLILSGFFMHVIPAALLMKEPTWLKRNKTEVRTDIQLVDGNNTGSSSMNNSSDFTKDLMPIGTTHYIKNDMPARRASNSLSYYAKKRSNSKDALPNGVDRNLEKKFYFANDFDLEEENFPAVMTIDKLNFELFFDIDIDYLKYKDEVVFQMLSMEIPDIAISYRAIMSEVDQKEIWHPEKGEVLQEIEAMYANFEKSLDIDQISNKALNINGMFLKNPILNGAMSQSKKSQSLRAVKKYIKSRSRSIIFSKIRSAPNITTIYNEIARKDYIITKLRLLSTTNEIRLISHLSQHNPRDVLKVLSQMRKLYKLHNNLENNASEAVLESAAPPIPAAEEPKVVAPETPIQSPPKTLLHYLKVALRLHTCAIFLLICLTRTIFFLSFNPVITTLVDFGIDRGLRPEDGKFLIATLSSGDLIGRLCLGWITDRGYVTLPKYVLVVMVLQGISTAALPLMHSKLCILLSIALIGMLQGSLFIRHPLLIVKYLDHDQRSVAAGCLDFMSGIVALLIPLYIGYFRDTIGSYDTVHYINGCISILVALGWMFESHFAKAPVTEESKA